MDELEAAILVLEEAGGGPLHWTVIQDRALRQGHLDPFTRPDIRKRLIAALAEAARAPEGRIARAGTGLYRIR
jgi:hypothetical protein